MASLWTKFTDIFSRNKSGVVPQAPSGTGTSKYLREDGTWAVPSGGGGGGSSTLADLEDVNLNNPSDGQILGYNATTQKWENKTPSATNGDVKFVCGEIWKSNNDQIKGYGGATLTFLNGIVRIDFAVRITTQGASSSDFTHGISVDAIRALLPNAPNITPIKGGYWDNGNRSGTSSQMGYCPTFALQNTTSRYWTPGRIYSTSSDDIGLWGAATFTRDMFIYGTCFGAYAKITDAPASIL